MLQRIHWNGILNPFFLVLDMGLLLSISIFHPDFLEGIKSHILSSFASQPDPVFSLVSKIYVYKVSCVSFQHLTWFCRSCGGSNKSLINRSC